MRLGSKLVMAMAGVLALTGAVEAAVMTTPVLLVGTNIFMSCMISNVSDKRTKVRIEVIGFYGDVLDDSGEITLEPGVSDGRSATEHARCRFTVDNKNAVRAMATVNQPGIGSTSVVEARCTAP